MRKKKNAKTIEESFLYQLSTSTQESSPGTFSAAHLGAQQKVDAENRAEKISLQRLKESAARLRYRLGGSRGII